MLPLLRTIHIVSHKCTATSCSLLANSPLHAVCSDALIGSCLYTSNSSIGLKNCQSHTTLTHWLNAACLRPLDTLAPIWLRNNHASLLSLTGTISLGLAGWLKCRAGMGAWRRLNSCVTRMWLYFSSLIWDNSRKNIYKQHGAPISICSP